LGTRGDVQPYAVLGQALKKSGHEVILSTAKNFESLIQSYGLDFVPVDADFQAMLESDELKKIRKNPFLAKKQLSKFVYPMIDDAFTTFYDLAKKSDRVLFHIKTMADNFADQFPEKMIKADVVPASQPTSAFPNPVFSFLPLPKFLNKLTFKITEWGLKMWTKPITDFRIKAGLPVKFQKPDLPSLYGISEQLLSKPKDFPHNSIFTGFWSGTSTAELSPDLVDFLQSGEPPLVVTFGSMPFDSKLDLKELIKSVTDKLQTRVILVKGWGLADIKDLEIIRSIKVISAAPYDKLFPRVKAIVHHGGVGTIAACLKAGKPFMTCPVLYPMGDQYFWGDIAFKKGVGLKPIPLKKITYNNFISNIKELLTNEELYKNARQLSEKLATEDGINNAIKIIEKNNG
ncbi:MAG TPA: glycosyltransferase, partial [Chitinophagales bacterium]|nr:glycosyltransferase [Chitinophagales bacterium]